MVTETRFYVVYKPFNRQCHNMMHKSTKLIDWQPILMMPGTTARTRALGWFSGVWELETGAHFRYVSME
jgi:hypothetical protein